MNVGTRSLLFGVHQFVWHPVTVCRAWQRLYGRPTWREVVCIVIHDWGYFGCADMDGEQGCLHPVGSAAIAGALLGDEYSKLVLLHSRKIAKMLKLPPSKLCWADKFSMLYDPDWLYLLRARASGEIAEYRAKAHEAGFIGLDRPDQEWLSKLKKHLSEMAVEHAAKFKAADQRAA